jgi:DNA-binding NarL/FixJ family response regulator
MHLLLCDDHEMFCEALSSLLGRRGHSVVGSPRTPEGAIELLRAHPAPDVVLLDLHFPPPSQNPVKTLHHQAPEVPIVVLTGTEDLDQLRGALDDGADGVALKTEGIDEIEQVLERVDMPLFRKTRNTAHPEKVWSRRARAVAQRQLRGRSDLALTARERDVLDRLARGEGTPMIANELGVGISTVRTHIQHLFVKFGVHSRLQLIAEVVRLGLVRVDGNGRPPSDVDGSLNGRSDESPQWMRLVT